MYSTYKTIQGKRQCSSVTIGGGCNLSLQFNFDRPPWDDRVRDRWASQAFEDTEKEIGVFQASSYTESEIEAVYKLIFDEVDNAPMSRNGLGCLSTTVELPKPVMVPVTYEKLDW